MLRKISLLLFVTLILFFACKSPTSPDTTPPSEVTNFVVISGVRQVTLSWAEPADVDFSHVEIWYGEGNTDTSFTGTIASTGTTIEGLTPSVEHNFLVKTVDSSGNTSAGVVQSATPKQDPISRQDLDTMIANGEDVTNVNTSGITDMSGLFKGESDFNQDISDWDVSNVKTMAAMFDGADAFNQDISAWDVSNVTDMSYMFYPTDGGPTAFNQDLPWDVSNVTNMKGMFGYASSFNGDISKWDVSSVTDMESMFQGATAFNQNISKWDVSNVTNMAYMFMNANAFDQDISSWSEHGLENTSHNLFSIGCPLLPAHHPYPEWDS